MYCRTCGRKIEENTTFCPYCGNSIVSVVMNNETKKQIEQISMNKKQMVSLIIAIISLILSFFVFSKICLIISFSTAIINTIYLFVFVKNKNKYQALILVFNIVAFLLGFILYIYLLLLN